MLSSCIFETMIYNQNLQNWRVVHGVTWDQKQIPYEFIKKLQNPETYCSHCGLSYHPSEGCK